MISHILTDQALTVLLDGRAEILPRSHPNFDAALQATLEGDVDALRAAIRVKETIAAWSHNRIEVIDRELFHNGHLINTSLAKKIVEFIREGNPNLAVPLCNFLDKVQLNPSYRAATGLYDWVAASNMPIHPDGDILAWKIVKEDYHDAWTGKFDHSPGKVVSQPRNMCDEDPDVTCSSGIHFCSFDYLPKYLNTDSRRIMLVKIHPADVVAIPREYGLAKGRCCRLLVLQEVPVPEDFFPTTTVYYEPEPKFKLGDIWVDTDGDRHTITGVTLEGITTVVDDYEWHLNLEGVGHLHDFHLQTLVQSALVDWTKPLCDGWVFKDIAPFDNIKIVRCADQHDGIWYFDIHTGDHIYRYKPTMRNA